LVIAELLLDLVYGRRLAGLFLERSLLKFQSVGVLIAFNKPFGVLSQFTPDGSPNRTLAEFSFPKGVYPLGRLDADSEGLLLLSDEPGLNTRLLDPERRHPRIYWAQVERVPGDEALAKLVAGPIIQGRKSEPCRARLVKPNPEPPPRDPPIRVRETVPTAWIELELIEGKNRQVRRMTAAVGHPTVRLIRVQIGNFRLGELAPGAWRDLTEAERVTVFSGKISG
jgi:23S rRNA pseudouridine2457 synthase